MRISVKHRAICTMAAFAIILGSRVSVYPADITELTLATFFIHAASAEYTDKATSMRARTGGYPTTTVTARSSGTYGRLAYPRVGHPLCPSEQLFVTVSGAGFVRRPA